MNIGFCAGSFDPFTKGHLSIIVEALKSFDRLIIGIGINPDKEDTMFFSLEERFNVVVNAVKDFTVRYGVPEMLEKIEVISYEEMTVEAALKHGASKLIRGIRGEEDLEYETFMAKFNLELSEKLGRKLETVFIKASPEIAHISSSLVRGLFESANYSEAMKMLMPSTHNAIMEKHYLKVAV